MSESFEVHSSIRDYRVDIEVGALESCLARDAEALLVCDRQILRQRPELDARAGLVPVLAEETHKNLAAVAEIIEALRGAGANRRSHVVAIGGGVVQDLATMAASIYMRGIDWTYCPTTLLGMVDSCLGGKSSINVGAYKNIAGNYYPPSRILIDPVFCRTLPATQRVAGLCEAAKICFCSRDDAFERYLAAVAGADVFDDEQRLAGLISLSLRTKKAFIEEDEFDHGVRLLLNFGHTFGHALEGASGFALSHGIAVGVGVLCAIDFSRRLGRADGSAPRTQAFAAHVRGLLGSVPGLEHRLAGIDRSEALRRFQSDKKHQRASYAVILAGPDGHVERTVLPADASIERHLLETFGTLRSLIS